MPRNTGNLVYPPFSISGDGVSYSLMDFDNCIGASLSQELWIFKFSNIFPPDHDVK